jgi:hypothetical protein
MEQRSTSAGKEEIILFKRSCQGFAAISEDILARLAVSKEGNICSKALKRGSTFVLAVKTDQKKSGHNSILLHRKSLEIIMTTSMELAPAPL